MHALIHCSHGRSFWDEAEKWFDFKLPRLHPTTWARDIMSDPIILNGDRAKIVSVMWSIWHSRNRWTHDEERLDPANSLRIIRETLAILELPKDLALALPGLGWLPRKMTVLRLIRMRALTVSGSKGGWWGCPFSHWLFRSMV